MQFSYTPMGVCSRALNFEVNDGKVSNVVFYGGCNGNLKAIAKLVEGKPAQEVIDILKGNTCGHKPTSCADQLARALEAALEKEKEQAQA